MAGFGVPSAAAAAGVPVGTAVRGAGLEAGGVADGAAGMTVGRGPPVRGVSFAPAVTVAGAARVAVAGGVLVAAAVTGAVGVAVAGSAPVAGSPSWRAAKPAHPAANPATAIAVTPAFSRPCRSFANPRPLPAIALPFRRRPLQHRHAASRQPIAIYGAGSPAGAASSHVRVKRGFVRPAHLTGHFH